MHAYADIQMQRYPANSHNTHMHTQTHRDKTSIANKMKKCIGNDNTL